MSPLSSRHGSALDDRCEKATALKPEAIQKGTRFTLRRTDDPRLDNETDDEDESGTGLRVGLARLGYFGRPVDRAPQLREMTARPVGLIAEVYEQRELVVVFTPREDLCRKDLS
jgi:hypothetical protein